MKIIIILILFLGTFNLTSSQKKVKATKSNISLVKGKYVLDKLAILKNNNLEKLIEELEKTELIEKQKVNEIPTFIMKLLTYLNEDFSIVGVGEEYSSGCTQRSELIQTNIKVFNNKTGDSLLTLQFGEPLPYRQLTYFGISDSIALMAYYHGGWAVGEYVIIIKFENTKIEDFWSGSLSGDLKNKKDILKYLKENNLIKMD